MPYNPQNSLLKIPKIKTFLVLILVFRNRPNVQSAWWQAFHNVCQLGKLCHVAADSLTQYNMHHTDAKCKSLDFLPETKNVPRASLDFSRAVENFSTGQIFFAASEKSRLDKSWIKTFGFNMSLRQLWWSDGVVLIRGCCHKKGMPKCRITHKIHYWRSQKSRLF